MPMRRIPTAAGRRGVSSGSRAGLRGDHFFRAALPGSPNFSSSSRLIPSQRCPPVTFGSLLHVVEASRQGKSTYDAPRALIARHAGVSVRTVTTGNVELEAAG